MKPQTDTSWEELDHLELPNGIVTSRFVLGDDDDPNAPVVFRSWYPPNIEIAPHTHAADYCEIVLEGSLRVTRRWFTAGDVRIVKGGTAYGPLVMGPEGCTALVIFADGRWTPVALPKGQTEGLHIDVLTAHYG